MSDKPTTSTSSVTVKSPAANAVDPPPTFNDTVVKPAENLLDVLEGRAPINEMKRVYRCKPLIVSGRQMTDSGVIGTSFREVEYKPTDWLVEHGGLTLLLTAAQFTGMYEVLDVGGDVIDAGLPDLDPGAEIERDGKRLVRVTVHAGNGAIAYWKDMRRFGGECEYKVTADNVDNHQASHRVGRFVEPWVGKAGERTWVVVER